MGKLIFWFLAILVALMVWRLINSRTPRTPSQTTPGQAPKNQAAEPMVRCAHCGIHLPRSEALQTQGHTWCSPEHARLGVRQP